jgi:hypothetical protein
MSGKSSAANFNPEDSISSFSGSSLGSDINDYLTKYQIEHEQNRKLQDRLAGYKTVGKNVICVIYLPFHEFNMIIIIIMSKSADYRHGAYPVTKPHAGTVLGPQTRKGRSKARGVLSQLTR